METQHSQSPPPLVSSPWAAGVEGHLWREQQGPWGWDLLESIPCPVRLHHPLENGIRANIFCYPADKSSELLGI